ncbi:hypothetical protein MAR_008182 [Mya arenaria]|uniref:Uncharacterized protein n=1 Tax=Mya arenaria TaxID=6604 RepID=A0ABY7DZQ3_MYAAR|nr:hypothetical protein MAR_008182 [Mya arenaria]
MDANNLEQSNKDETATIRVIFASAMHHQDLNTLLKATDLLLQLANIKCKVIDGAHIIVREKSERPYANVSEMSPAWVLRSPSPEFIVLDEYSSEEEEMPQAVDTPELLGTLNGDDMRKQIETWKAEKDEDFVIPRNKGNKAKVMTFCIPVMTVAKKPFKPAHEALPVSNPKSSKPEETHEPADLPELWGYHMSTSMEREMAEWKLEALTDFIVSSKRAGKGAGQSKASFVSKKPVSCPVMKQSQLEPQPDVLASVASRKRPLKESEALTGGPPSKIHINRNHPSLLMLPSLQTDSWTDRSPVMNTAVGELEGPKSLKKQRERFQALEKQKESLLMLPSLQTDIGTDRFLVLNTAVGELEGPKSLKKQRERFCKHEDTPQHRVKAV